MRHPTKNIIRTMGLICLALLLVAGAALSVCAAENNSGEENNISSSEKKTTLLPVEDLRDEQVILTAILAYDDEEIKETVPVVGAVIDLYKVAGLVTEGGAAHYLIVDSFASTGIDFEGMTASESLEAAETINKIILATNPIPFLTATTNEQGYAVFSDLDPGIYLGRQRDLVQISEFKKITMEPVLWMAPMYMLNSTQDGYIWNYTTEVYPKEGELERIPTPTPTVTPTVTMTPTVTVKPTVVPTITRVPDTPSKTTTATTATTSTKIVKTGDNSPIGMYIIIGIAAVIIIVMVLRKKKR